MSDVSSPVCTNGVWPPRGLVSVVQKNKPSNMLFSNAYSIDLHMDCMAWRCWTMRQSNDCSTPAPRSGAVKQWLQQLAQKKTKTQSIDYKLIFTLSMSPSRCSWSLWRQSRDFPTTPRTPIVRMYLCSPVQTNLRYFGLEEQRRPWNQQGKFLKEFQDKKAVSRDDQCAMAQTFALDN